MKSNVCKIEKGTKDLEAIFNECEKVAEYNRLTHKQALQLRLICEEIDGMLPKITDDFDGNIWFEFEDGVCKVNVEIELEDITADEKERLISISRSKNNAAAVGVLGKIRSAIEDFFLNDEVVQAVVVKPGNFYLSTGFIDGVDYAFLWSLDQYRELAKKNEESEEWDELEKSVIASVADDVIVGVKGKTASIVVVKKFC